MTSSNLSKNWQLSAYELQRLPHKLVTDDTEENCGDGLPSPLLRGVHHHIAAQVQKECPTCRRKLVSKRSLRRDYRMDAMIAALLPNYDEDGASSAERATASQGGQLREGVKRGVPKQACADGVARKGSDYRLTSRLPEGSQEPNAGARRVDARVLGEGVRPLPPPPSVAFAGIARRSASNAVSAASPAQVDHDATDTSEEASRVTSAQRSELIQSENFHADTGETSEDARGKSATDAAAMPTAAANRESSSTAFAPRRIRDYVMTLKPHLDTFLVNAESPMLR
ncbi:hypothetical protein HPB49_024557 [Dermacentor silvarum]|uniref:Uncharacterized protein n=1 Tax=Dermacentor silvarum TaxID=543639 RepID=A0ACB8DS32_DERSI|nr:hypothetical protein HPB49_024557 [Dermacentor silvarum]